MKHLLWWVFVLLLTAACANDKDFTPTDEPAMLVSGNVSVREAEQNLKKLYPEFYPTTRGNEMPRIASRISYAKNLQPTTRSTQEPLFYVFNFEDNQGFAIMSASKKMPDLLAISDKGNLDFSQLPDNGIREFASRLKTYSSSFDSIWTGHKDRYTYYSDWTTTKEIGPLCKVKWHQSSPYNMYMGSNMAAGCGTVAIAQALSVYGYPTSYESYSFDWNAMRESNPSDDAVCMIARLMKIITSPDVGDFYPLSGGYGADIGQVVNAFKALGYSDAKEYVEKSGSSLIGYYRNEIVRNELIKSRPVLVWGRSSQPSSLNDNHW